MIGLDQQHRAPGRDSNRRYSAGSMASLSGPSIEGNGDFGQPDIVIKSI